MKSITITIGIIFVIALCGTVSSKEEKKVVCYYGSWASYRQGNGKVTVDDLDPNKCTHIIYTFTGLSENNEVKLLDPWLDEKALKKLRDLKCKNPNLKTMVAIGGWNEGSTKYSKMASDPAARKKFAKSASEFLKKWDLDGFDVDWEYPADRGGVPADKKNFVELLKDLRKEFKPNNYLLSVAVGATKWRRDQSYDVKGINDNVDFINVMAYDLHSHADGKTGFNAPLYGTSNNNGDDTNIHDIVKGWINDGADSNKLILGLAFYGKTFRLANQAKTGVGASTNGAGQAGVYTKEAGIMAYSEICQKIKNEGWKSSWDDTQKVPYAHNSKEWVGYDDVKSIKLKSNFAKKMNLGGVMMWSIEQDDIRNLCGDGKYPLLTAINKELGTGSNKKKSELPPFCKESEPTTKKPISNLPESNNNDVNDNNNISEVDDKNTTENDNRSVENNKNNQPPQECEGLEADPNDCNGFYLCANGTRTRMSCPSGTAFDKNLKICNYADDVQC